MNTQPPKAVSGRVSKCVSEKRPLSRSLTHSLTHSLIALLCFCVSATAQQSSVGGGGGAHLAVLAGTNVTVTTSGTNVTVSAKAQPFVITNATAQKSVKLDSTLATNLAVPGSLTIGNSVLDGTYLDPSGSAYFASLAFAIYANGGFASASIYDPGGGALLQLAVGGQGTYVSGDLTNVGTLQVSGGTLARPYGRIFTTDGFNPVNQIGVWDGFWNINTFNYGAVALTNGNLYADTLQATLNPTSTLTASSNLFFGGGSSGAGYASLSGPNSGNTVTLAAPQTASYNLNLKAGTSSSSIGLFTSAREVDLTANDFYVLSGNGLLDLGRDGKGWKNLYLSGLISNYAGATLTLGSSNVFIPGHLKLDSTHSLSLSNATASKVAVFAADKTVTNSALGAVPINGDTTATTAGQLNALLNTTNLSTMAPNFALGYSMITTNAAFTFLAPINVTATLAETAVLLVTNSTASAVAVTAPAGVKTQGTFYVTNVSSFTFFHYGNAFTNCVALPLY